MAIYKAPNIDINIPEEGELFIGKEDPRFVYKRVGEKVYHTWAKDVPGAVNLPTRGIADFAGILGAGKYENWQSPSFFTTSPIVSGQNLSAMEQTLRAQGLAPGSAVPGLTVGANIVAQPQIAPQSTLGVVAQGIADVQRRIDELSGKPLTTSSVTGTGSVPYVPPPSTTFPSVFSIVGPTLGTSVTGTGGTGVGEVNMPLTSAQQEAQTMNERLRKLNLELAGKPSSELEQQKTEGLPEMQKTKRDLTSQLLALDAQSKAIPMQIQQDFAGRGVTAAGAAPIETAALRTNAIQALLISAQINAIDGKIGTANYNVEQAIKTKYAQKEADRDALIANLELAQKSPAYTVSEKKQAAELLIAQNQLKEAEKKIEKNEENTEKAKVKYVGKVSNDTYLKIQKATTEAEVENIVQMSGDLTGQLKEEIVGGFRVLRDTTGKVISTREVGDGGVDILSGASDLEAYASQFSDTGKLPSPAELKLSGLNVGQVTAMAKQMPKPNGAVVSTNTGTKSSAISPTQEEGIIATSEIITYILPSLKDKFSKIATGVLGGIGGVIWTSQDKQDYLTFRQEFLNKLLKARSGATVTPQEYDRYAKMLPTTFNQPFFLGADGLKKLNSLTTSIKNSLDTILNTQQLSIYGYSKVKVGGVERTVGETLDIGGIKYRVLPDGRLTDIL